MENIGVNINGTENQTIKPMNFMQRAAGVVFSPAETMKNISVKPGFLFPLILIAITSFLFIFLNFDMYKEYTLEATRDMMVKMNADIPEEQLLKQVDFSTIIGLVGAPFGGVIGWLIGAAILFAAVKIFKGEGNLKQYLSVTGYAYVIMTFSIILTTVVSHITGTFNMQTSVTSLASLLPTNMEGNFVFGLLNGIEVFSIWYYVVIGIGTSVVSKLEKKKVYSVVAGLYVLFVLFTAASTAVGSMFK